jgi:hypothetical protein
MPDKVTLVSVKWPLTAPSGLSCPFSARAVRPGPLANAVLNIADVRTSPAMPDGVVWRRTITRISRLPFQAIRLFRLRPLGDHVRDVSGRPASRKPSA